jgi:metal-sulfur cluster biosynthetic enzyme
MEKYPIRRVSFGDDTFNLDKKWVKEFGEKYKKNFDVNWSCNIELTSIDEDMVQSMADSGCRGCVFGLESGVESIRMNVLNKKITNARYIEATNWLKKYNLKFLMNMMFCLPKESLDDAIEGLRFATQLKSNGIRAGILKMYKGTELANYAKAKGLSEGIGEFTYKAKDFHGEFHRIVHVTWATALFHRFPLLLRWGRTILTKKFGKVLGPIHLLLHWEDIKFFDIPLWQAWKYFWNSRDTFIGGMAKAQADTYIGDDGTVRDSKELFASPLGVVDWGGEKSNKIFKGLNKERYKELYENDDAHFSSMEPEILNALRQVKIPHKNGKDIVDLGMVSNIDMADGSVTFIIKTNSEKDWQWPSLKKDAEKAVLEVDGVFKVTARSSSDTFLVKHK